MSVFCATFTQTAADKARWALLWSRWTRRLKYKGSKRRRAALRLLRLHWAEEHVQAALADAAIPEARRSKGT